MDFKQIRYFVSVAEAGSFSAGARRAFVTQPTLSAAIAALEAELGFALLERHARGVRLTPRGEEVLETARSILRQTERLKAASGGKPPARPLRLGILPTIAPALVAQCIARLRAIEPGRFWRSEDAPLPKLQQRLANGRYDVVLTALGPAARGHRQSQLAADRQALAVSARTFPRGPVSPEILAGQPLIVRVHCEQLQSASRILDAWKVRPQVVAQTDSDARALAMVAAGLGFCLMPDSFEHPEVRMLRPEGVDLPRRLGFEWVKGGGDGWLDRALDRL
jgi:DNA-binding transcriptional LysR family regulator